MAIYSVRHSSVGRSTHAAGTAGAHADYITRSGACDFLLGEHMPVPTVGSRGGPARQWLDEQEAADRKNARVIDKLTLALPHELNPKQQVELVRNFAASMTGGKAPYLAAFHRIGKDVENQHCHLILRDRNIETGKRVWGNEKTKTTEIMREKWEEATNAALAKANAQERIDRRSLKDQGIDRKPQKHLGPVAAEIIKRGGKSWKGHAITDTLAPRDPEGPVAHYERFVDQVACQCEEVESSEGYFSRENLEALRSNRAKMQKAQMEAKASGEPEWYRIMFYDLQRDLGYIDRTIKSLEKHLSIEPEATPEPSPRHVGTPQARETPAQAQARQEAADSAAQAAQEATEAQEQQLSARIYNAIRDVKYICFGDFKPSSVLTMIKHGFNLLTETDEQLKRPARWIAPAGDDETVLDVVQRQVDADIFARDVMRSPSRRKEINELGIVTSYDLHGHIAMQVQSYNATSATGIDLRTSEAVTVHFPSADVLDRRIDPDRFPSFHARYAEAEARISRQPDPADLLSGHKYAVFTSVRGYETYGHVDKQLHSASIVQLDKDTHVAINLLRDRYEEVARSRAAPKPTSPRPSQSHGNDRSYDRDDGHGRN